MAKARLRLYKSFVDVSSFTNVFNNFLLGNAPLVLINLKAFQASLTLLSARAVSSSLSSSELSSCSFFGGWSCEARGGGEGLIAAKTVG